MRVENRPSPGMNQVQTANTTRKQRYPKNSDANTVDVPHSGLRWRGIRPETYNSLIVGLYQFRNGSRMRSLHLPVDGYLSSLAVDHIVT